MPPANGTVSPPLTISPKGLIESAEQDIVVYGKADPNDYLFWCLVSAAVFGVAMNAFIYINLSITQNLNYHLKLLKSLTFTDSIQNLLFIAQISYPNTKGLPEGIVGDLLCRVYLSSFLVLTLTAASSWLVVLLSLELYGSSIDFHKPKWYKLMFKTPNRIRFLAVFCWVAGIFIMVDSPFNFYTDGDKCILGEKSDHFSKYIGATMQLLLLIVFPLILIFSSYFKLISRTKEAMIFHRNWRQLAPGSEFNYLQAKKMIWTLYKRLAIIVVFHILAWGPNQLFWWVYVSGVVNLDRRLLGYRYDQLIQLSPIINCALNPIFYGWTWFEFRDIIVPRLRKIFPCCRRHEPMANEQSETELATKPYRPPLHDVLNYRPTTTST